VGSTAAGSERAGEIVTGGTEEKLYLAGFAAALTLIELACVPVRGTFIESRMVLGRPLHRVSNHLTPVSHYHAESVTRCKRCSEELVVPGDLPAVVAPSRIARGARPTSHEGPGRSQEGPGSSHEGPGSSHEARRHLDGDLCSLERRRSAPPGRRSVPLDGDLCSPDGDLCSLRPASHGPHVCPRCAMDLRLRSRKRDRDPPLQRGRCRRARRARRVRRGLFNSVMFSSGKAGRRRPKPERKESF
jgi:hypothetical protein